MIKEEFVRKRAALDRETPPFDTLAAVGIVALATIGAVVPRFSSDVVTWAYIGFLLVSCVSYMIYATRWARRTGLLCESCKRPLLGRAADSALKTGDLIRIGPN